MHHTMGDRRVSPRAHSSGQRWEEPGTARSYCPGSWHLLLSLPDSQLLLPLLFQDVSQSLWSVSKPLLIT